ncbi:MFS transporter [Profundibacter sp.]|uniref:MFS transporter n=1 Tax=Profundibacter sp. TaxID=3101071 RepID=UPI003D0AA093
MKLGIFTLVLAYMLSQFYRAFLAVLTPALKADIGALPDDLSLASGMWFLAFAVMQLPVGWALDKIGPKRTASILLAFGGAGGALVFGLAQSPLHIIIAMVLLGIGCAPVLMASFYIFARSFLPVVFASLAGAIIGFGSLGNIASSLPMTWASETFGWRETLFALAAITLAVALAILLFVKDPETPAHEQDAQGSVFSLLKMPALWLIFPMMTVNYAAAAGIRGLWIGPYLSDVFTADAAMIGKATLAMGLAMALGNFVYGPLDRLFPTRKWIVFWGNLAAAISLLSLYFLPASNLWFSIAMMAAVGLFAASFAVIIAHARAFIPPHLTGRGVTLLNLFGIGGAGILQSLSGRVHGAALVGATDPAQPYQALFLFFGGAVLVGVLIYGEPL